MSYELYEYEDYGGEWPETLPRDQKVDEVKAELVKFFNDNPKNVYYLMQVEVIFEKKPYGFFHWITYKAVNELIEDGVLGEEELPLTQDETKSTRIKYVFNKKLRDHKMPIRRSLEIVREYSKPEIAIACGQQAEVLFLNAFAAKGFVVRGQNTNEFGGKKWVETEHDLDFILEKGGVIYGYEVKNKWSYIEKDELTLKLRLCKYLGIKPVFIMRQSPKSYNWEIIQNGGYALIFEAHIFPFGQKELVARIKEVLGLPVDCPRAIPSGIIERFIKWHEAIKRREGA